MDTAPETIVKKIDSILYELQELRRSILEQAQHSDGNLAEDLYGALARALGTSMTLIWSGSDFAV